MSSFTPFLMSHNKDGTAIPGLQQREWSNAFPSDNLFWPLLFFQFFKTFYLHCFTSSQNTWEFGMGSESNYQGYAFLHLLLLNAVAMQFPSKHQDQILPNYLPIISLSSCPKTLEFSKARPRKQKAGALIADTTKQIYLLAELIYRSPKSHPNIPCATPASVSPTISSQKALWEKALLCFFWGNV